MSHYRWQNVCRKLYFNTCLYSVASLSIVHGIILTSNLSCHLLRNDATTQLTTFSALPFGAILSPLIFTFVATKYGRKLTLIGIGIALMLSQITTAVSHCLTKSQLQIMSQTITGLSIGGLNTVLTLYINELTVCVGKTTKIQLQFFAFGILLNYAFDLNHITTNTIILCVISMCLVLLVCILPETPPFLIYTKKELEGKHVLIKLKNTTEIDNDFRELCNNYEQKPMDLWVKIKKWRIMLGLHLVLITLKELSLGVFVYFYSTQFLIVVSNLNSVLTLKLLNLTENHNRIKISDVGGGQDTNWELPLIDIQLVLLGFVQFIGLLVILRFSVVLTSNRLKATHKTIMAACFIFLCMFGLFPLVIYLKCLKEDVELIENRLELPSNEFKVIDLSVMSLNANRWTSWVPVFSFGVILCCYNTLSICLDDFISMNHNFDSDQNKIIKFSWIENIWVNAIYHSWVWFLWFIFTLIFKVIVVSNAWILFCASLVACFLGLFIIVLYLP